MLKSRENVQGQPEFREPEAAEGSVPGRIKGQKEIRREFGHFREKSAGKPVPWPSISLSSAFSQSPLLKKHKDRRHTCVSSWISFPLSQSQHIPIFQSLMPSVVITSAFVTGFREAIEKGHKKTRNMWKGANVPGKYVMAMRQLDEFSRIDELVTISRYPSRRTSSPDNPASVLGPLHGNQSIGECLFSRKSLKRGMTWNVYRH